MIFYFLKNVFLPHILFYWNQYFPLSAVSFSVCTLYNPAPDIYSVRTLRPNNHLLTNSGSKYLEVEVISYLCMKNNTKILCFFFLILEMSISIFLPSFFLFCLFCFPYPSSSAPVLHSSTFSQFLCAFSESFLLCFCKSLSSCLSFFLWVLPPYFSWRFVAVEPGKLSKLQLNCWFCCCIQLQLSLSLRHLLFSQSGKAR